MDKVEILFKQREKIFNLLVNRVLKLGGEKWDKFFGFKLTCGQPDFLSAVLPLEALIFPNLMNSLSTGLNVINVKTLFNRLYFLL